MLILGSGERLTIDDVVRVARHGEGIELAPQALLAIRRGEDELTAHARAGRTIYGFTTGVGPLDSRPLTPEDNRAFQRNLLLSHAAGVGPPMTLERVRAMLLARINVLVKGRSGARLDTVRALALLLVRGVHPIVPEIGSVGASDLAALAHASLLLAGEGWALVDGARVSGRVAMEAAGIALPELSGRDGLALINGPSQTLGTGALATFDARALVNMAEIAAALSMLGAASRTDFLDARILARERHPEVAAAVARLRHLLALDDPSRTVAAPSTLREPLSTRCAPEVFGAVRAACTRAKAAIEIDLDATIDNPTILPDGDLSNNAGTMHAQIVAEALDGLAASVITLATMSERRIARLLDPHHNGGLPAFLVHPEAKSGLHSGLMIAQYTAAAIVAELRVSAGPAGVHTLPVANGTEDHGSMSALAARRAAWAVSLTQTMIAIELLTAAQAIDLRAREGAAALFSEDLAAAYRAVREASPTLVEDRLLAEEIESVTQLVRRSG